MTEPTATKFEYDRSTWPKGPWDDEPDREQWRTASGLPGLIVRGPFGNLCGYAAVPPGHPLHGAESENIHFDVHGGLTYANACAGNICHVPEPGEPDDVWWFGFDCGHFRDLMPGMVSISAGSRLWDFCTYRTIAYVRAEVESLALQLAELGPARRP